MRTRWGALLLSISACGFSGSEGVALVDDDGDDGAEEDPVDVPAPPPACVPGFVDLCAQLDPGGTFSISNAEIDTDQDTRCRVVKQPNGPDLCLFYFTDVELQAGGVVLAFGSRPFALVAKNTLKIAGTLDVSSKRQRPKRGAGSAPTQTGLCGFTTQPGTAMGGGGGGAGGTLVTAGGAGATGNQDGIGGGNANVPGGTPGAAQDAPLILRGGCDGQTGANGQGGADGTGGQGGGAVYLAAASMQITGAVLAGGAGGTGGGNDDGGGGGGSGGVIVAQSDSLMVSGTLLATGGGGGQGGSGFQGGDAGDDASTTTSAQGGQQGGGGGRGGDGATNATGMGGQPNGAGAGGGGGGAGLVLLLGPQLDTGGAKIAPTVTKRAK
jgi:hypothetical protein